MMNLNQFDFTNLSMYELGRIGAKIREEELIPEQELARYINRFIIERNHKISRSARIRMIKKILFSLGASYSEFNAIYANLDQEIDSMLNGD
ncbi:MAG: hypothetical protein IJ575_09950 [Selenomonadaceae bacterium]|nr:hypothetical protein [Selenomonadaceae bacterium]